MTRLTFGRTDRSKVVESFAPTAGRVLGILTMAIGALILVDILIEWRTWSGFTTAAVVVAVTTFVWLGLVRPCVVAYEDCLVLRNMLRDVRIPWKLVESVEIAPVLRVVAGGRAYRSSAVALTGADRRAVRRSQRGRRGERPEDAIHGISAGGGDVAQPGRDLSPSDYTISRIETMAGKYAEDASQSASGPAEVEYVWRWTEFVLVGVAIVIAVVASLLG